MYRSVRSVFERIRMNQRYEKQEAGKIVVQNRFVKWLDNFWYHYKWHTIAIGFFVFVFVVCFVQCSTSQGAADFRIAYVGGYAPSAEERQGIIGVLESVAPDNKEGADSAVDLRTFGVYSEEQIKELCWDEEAEQVHTPSANSLQQLSRDNFSQFYTYSQTGDAAVWIVSEDVYEKWGLDKTRLRPLSDLYETTPDSAYDEYAIRLSETDLYRAFDALKVLPEDTLIVLPRQLVLGSSSDDETYALFVEMFRAIVDYKAPAVQQG